MVQITVPLTVYEVAPLMFRTNLLSGKIGDEKRDMHVSISNNSLVMEFKGDDGKMKYSSVPIAKLVEHAYKQHFSGE